MWHLKYLNWFGLLKLKKLQNKMVPACRLCMVPINYGQNIDSKSCSKNTLCGSEVWCMDC